MQSLSDEVFRLDQDELTSLPARSMRTGLFGKKLEDALQTLLERYPQIIPGRQIYPASEDPPRFALLGREVPVSGGSVDLLYVDQRGVLTLLETKLAQNPESRREIIGQIIEYAANASESWGKGQARELAATYWSSMKLELDQVLQEQLGRETDEETFDVGILWDDIEENLGLGRVRLIIVADEIRPEARRMIEYLNREMQNAEVLGLELRCYGQDASRLVLVPRLMGQAQGKTPAEAIQWTPEKLRTAYQELSDSALGQKMLQVLKWAQENSVFLPARAKSPTFGLRGNSGHRLGSFFHNGGIYVFLNDKSFAGGTTERDQFVQELKGLEFLDKSFEIEEPLSGRGLAASLTELDEKRLTELLALLRRYC